MQKIIITVLFLLAAGNGIAQRRFSKNELSINAFRNPSVGAEFRYRHMSFHAGYYPTAFKSGENTSFVKTGLTVWFLPVDKKAIPSSFYAGVSYLRGFNRDYDGANALGLETGFRWMVWKGINLRLGGIAVIAAGKSVKINPTPGISYSFIIK